MFGAFTTFGRMGAGANAPWSPTTLFAAGEQGGVWDFTNLSNLYQDSAGTTPVTAVGDPIGLVLDTKNGTPVLGPELFLYGDGSTTGWTYPGGAGGGVSSSGGQLILTTASALTAVTDRLAYAAIAGLVVGSAYKLTVSARNISDPSGARISVASSCTVGDGVGVYVDTTGTELTDLQLVFVATNTTMYVRLVARNGAPGSQVACDNISVREIPGNHLSQSTSTARALYKATGNAKWCDYDEIDDLHTATFASSLGSSCTVARANVGSTPTILTSQTIGTSYTSNTDTAALVIVNRALTAGETASLTAWLTAKGAT